ncbi:MAG: hypothetical protein E3J64_00735 [Anaerolineales bacterium]|nr:MAG: hypothetical protein E3J64_00735 [Anaerolineales bacterium]
MIAEIMHGLAVRRPVFHSEADFQHAIAWAIHETWPDASIRLEYPILLSGDQAHIDICVRMRNAVVLVELKYKTRALKAQVGDETYSLRAHAAQDISRYDYVKDISRVEQAVAGLPHSTGYAVFLTNDSSYWKRSRKARPVDADFRIHAGRSISGKLEWRGAGSGTTKGREAPVRLRGEYTIQWQEYSSLGVGVHDTMRYTVATVTPSQPS